MADQAEPRLVEGPICSICNRALDMSSKLRESEGSETTLTHRDGEIYDKSHKPVAAYKVIRP